jgi:simple sugar transport system permease protein
MIGLGVGGFLLLLSLILAPKVWKVTGSLIIRPDFWGQVLRITVPFVLAALGGALSERSGVINIALEGKLLFGAFTGAVAAYYSGSVFVGVVAGAGGGLLMAGLYGVSVLRFRADQIVAGVAINLLAIGLTRYLLKLIFNSTANSPETPGFSGGVLTNPYFWGVCALVVGVWGLVFRTAFGLRLRFAGEHPEAADSLGVSVNGVRWRAVLLAGALAGLGGAWLAAQNHGFVAEMSGGRGYIALAAVIMGKWHPGFAAAACLLFGFADAWQINLQAQSIELPRELVQILPYLLTMIALAGFIGRSRPPKALGQHLD